MKKTINYSETKDRKNTWSKTQWLYKIQSKQLEWPCGQIQTKQPKTQIGKLIKYLTYIIYSCVHSSFLNSHMYTRVYISTSTGVSIVFTCDYKLFSFIVNSICVSFVALLFSLGLYYYVRRPSSFILPCYSTVVSALVACTGWKISTSKHFPYTSTVYGDDFEKSIESTGIYQRVR